MANYTEHIPLKGSERVVVSGATAIGAVSDPILRGSEDEASSCSLVCAAGIRPYRFRSTHLGV